MVLLVTMTACATAERRDPERPEPETPAADTPPDDAHRTWWCAEDEHDFFGVCDTSPEACSDRRNSRLRGPLHEAAPCTRHDRAACFDAEVVGSVGRLSMHCAPTAGSCQRYRFFVAATMRAELIPISQCRAFESAPWWCLTIIAAQTLCFRERGPCEFLRDRRPSSERGICAPQAAAVCFTSRPIGRPGTHETCHPSAAACAAERSYIEDHPEVATVQSECEEHR
jgi:hypothetical protein